LFLIANLSSTTTTTTNRFTEINTALFVGNKQLTQFLSTDESFKWRLERLHELHGIYSPLARSGGMSLRDIFVNFYGRRDLWDAVNVVVVEDVEDDEALPMWRLPKKPKSGSNFKISVSARFKPEAEVEEGGAE